MKTTYRAMKNGKLTMFTMTQDKIQEFLNKYPDAILVQSGTVSTGIGEKSIQLSKFENAPGLSEFPAADEKAFKEAKPKTVADYFNRKLKDDGWDFEVEGENLTAKAPNGETKKFLLQAPTGFKVNKDGSISSAGSLSLPTSMKIATQDEIREFINKNQLDLQGNIDLDNRRYKIQKFLSDNFEVQFDELLKEEDLTNIIQNAKSPIAELEKQNPQLFDEVRNKIVEQYEDKYGSTEGLTDYQIEDLFINVTNYKKSVQLRKTSDLINEVKKTYEDGWAMNGRTVQDMVDYNTSRIENEIFTPNEKKLYDKIKSYERTTLRNLKEFENSEDFDENDPDYLAQKETASKWELYLKDELSKIYGDEASFYVDFNTGNHVDQNYEDDESKLDITDQVNQHIETILDANEGEDNATVREKLKVAYEEDAFERSLFLNHIEGTTVNIKWHSGMSVNDYGEDKDDDMNFFAFRNQLKRLGYSYKPGEDIRGVTVNDIINNWNVFSKYLDNAYIDSSNASFNYLGDDIDQEDIGGYIKATKDMSINMIARDRAWSQLYLLNVDPSSYKRSKKDLYFSSLVSALPFTDNYMQADAKERTAQNFRGGAYSGDQRISNINMLIDEVNQELEAEGEAPIKISKAFSDKLELSSAERFWQGAGGFTPMLAEFAVVGGIAKGAMSLTGAASWLNKMRSGLYYSKKTNQFVSAANVTSKATKAGKKVDAYAKSMGLVKSRFNSTWGNGLFHLSYGLLEEGKMQMLDPLFGTEMPLGSGLGFYFGGTAARAAMPFKFGSATSKGWQRIGSAINPISEKVIKGGVGGAVAAEVALPMEQLLAGHKSWRRWKEETYPDMDVIQNRFIDNLYLFGALGITHLKSIDRRFMVGMGRSSVSKWNKKALEFQKILDKGGEVDGKKYTAEEAKAEMYKYAELVAQGQSYIRASELIPQMQDPAGQKKMIESQFDAINKDAVKSTGELAFEYEVTTDGKNFEGRTEPAYFIEKNGKSVIYVDARKIIDGQIPHEVFHHITMHHLAKGKKDGRVSAELAELSARIKEYVQKAVKEATEGDLDFKKFIESQYGNLWNKDVFGEIPANLIELMASSRGYDLFVSNNLISDIAFEMTRLSEKIFTDAKGNTRGGYAGKLLQPRLNLSDPKTVIDYLARLSTGLKGGEYNMNVINRLKKLFEDMKLEDGKVIKTEKDGSETVVSTNSANIAEQARLKSLLKPIIENYKKQITELNDQRSKGDITNAEYNKLREKYLKEFQEKRESLTANLVDIRDANDDDLRANSTIEKNIKREKATSLEGWKNQIDAKFDGKKYIDSYNKYIEEGKSKEEAERLVKEEWQGSREQGSIAESIFMSRGLKNSISQAKTRLGSGSEGGKIIEDYQGQFYEDVIAEVNERYSKNYNPGKINDTYGRALTPWEWLTTGHRSGRSNLYRAVGDAAKKHGAKVATVSVEATEGGWTAFEGHTASGGYMKSSKPTNSVAEQTGIELSKSLEGMNKQVDGGRLGDVIDQKIASDAKNLNWEARGAKDIVSYKNIAKNAKETIGKEVHLDYFGVEAEMYKKMNKSAAQQLNAGDIKSIVDVIKGDIANHLAMLPLWKQYILDPVSGENVAFEIVAGKFKSEPKATGVTTSVLKNPLLYKEIVQTGTKGNKYEWSDRLKEYHKTNNTEVKEAFEQEVIRSLTEGKNRAEISGILKGWMTQMEKALYVQGVNKALPNIPELTTRYKLVEMVNQISAGKSPELASKAIMEKISIDIENILKQKEVVKWSDVIALVNSDPYKSKFPKEDIKKVANELAKLQRQQKEFEHGVIEDLSKQEELAVRDSKVESEMEAMEAKNYKDLVSQIKEQFPKDKDIQEAMDMLIGEGLENWSINNALEVAVQNKFDGALINQYNKSQVLEYAKQIIMSTMYQGKVKRGNPITNKLERMNLPEGNKTADGYFEFHMDTKWEGTDVDMPFLEHLKVIDTGKFKTHMAKFITENQNAENLVELVWNEGRKLLTKEGSTYEQTVQAGKEARNFHLDAMREVVVNHNKYGLTRAEAIRGYFRHMRAQTNITNGMIKGTATVTSATKELGEPVGKDPSAKNYLGSMYHAEHQLQLLNFALMNASAMFRSGKNTAKYVKQSRELSDLFEQSIQTKQDQLTYDSRPFGGNTGFLNSFKGKPIGELMSILNVMHRPGVAFETVDFTASKPMTIGERIINNYTKKQVSLLLKEAAKTGEINSLHHELKFMNENRPSREVLKKVGLEGIASKDIASTVENIDKAMRLARKRNKKAKGISVFDFDETVGISDNYVIARKGGKTKRISSAEWPFLGDKMMKEGWEMDFSDFNRVTDGRPGPLMQKMKNQIKKYGPKDVFILTARAPESQKAIHDYLKSEGIDIPIENITGLGNSTGEAKAMWMLEKYAKGYNDMYFVDDALPNVKAVKKVLDQLDIKSKVQQALASQNISAEVNKIMEHSLDIKAEKKFSKAEAKVRGGNIKRRRIFMTDSAADLELLLEPLYGKGSKGIENKKWFEENFIKHFERGYNDINNAKQKAANEYMLLRKQNKDIVKSLDKEVSGTAFTTDMAIRVYIWNKNGVKVPDLAKSTERKLINHIKGDAKLKAFAENTGRIAKIKDPSESWWAETIAGEISDLGLGTSRSKFLADFIDAKNEIFSEENLNKMESKLGSNWRKNLEEMFYRMETGQTRRADLGTAGNKIMDYLNGSVGTIMNFNTRSATLQLISSVNFINHSFNNPLAATRAFANQPQYWKDFMTIMNSDMLVQRRAGLKINVTEAELAVAASKSKNPARAVMAKIIKAGYIPTKIADSFAIASGGATYYRNSIKKYMKEGLSKAEAEKKAFIDFQAIAERTQQSSRPDLLSAQQVSWGGRIVLPFANTPMQMNRIMMKELLDLKNGRYKGSFGDNSFTNKMSKVAYYGFVQSVIFAGLQSGLFALIFNSDDDDLKAKKMVQSVNTVADSFLRGMGIPGAVLSGIKNAALEFKKQNEKNFGADYDEVGEDLLNISPTIGSKFTKFDAAGNTYMYNKKEIQDEGLTLDGPALEGLTMLTEAIFNLPVNRAYRKISNIRAALDDQNEAWQRVLVGMGWSKWDVGIGQREVEEKKAKKKAEKEAKKVQCFHIKSNGDRCKNKTENKNKKCYAHQ